MPRVALQLLWLDEIDSHWPLLEGFFARIPAKVTTEVTPDEIRKRAKDRRLLIYLILVDSEIKGCFASGVRICGSEKVAFVEAIAGDDLDSWLGPALNEFEARCKSAGVTIIEHEGRFGWERKLPGYRPVRVVMQKVL